MKYDFTVSEDEDDYVYFSSGYIYRNRKLTLNIIGNSEEINVVFKKLHKLMEKQEKKNECLK